MANVIDNILTAQGANVSELLKATTRRFTEDEEGWTVDPQGSVIAHFSDNCVKLPASRRKHRTVVFPDSQTVRIEGDKIEYRFESKWSSPLWEVQALSVQFPSLTFRLWGWDGSMGHGWYYAIEYGKVTELDMRETWNPRQKELAAKYQIKVTSDIMYGGDLTQGTILFEDAECTWTWTWRLEPTGHTVVIWKDNTVIYEENGVLDESQPKPFGIYEAVVNELQAGFPPVPRDGGGDGDDDNPEPDEEHTVLNVYSAAAGR